MEGTQYMADKVLLVNAVFLAMTNDNFKRDFEELVNNILNDKKILKDT